jgi:Ion channel
VCRSLTTLSTVGYGDITPHSHFVFFGFFLLFSTVLFAYLLGELVSAVVDLKKFQQLEKFFQGGLSEGMLRQLDSVDGDGTVRADLLSQSNPCARRRAPPRAMAQTRPGLTALTAVVLASRLLSH